MIPIDRFREILLRLLERSKSNGVRWRKTQQSEGETYDLYFVLFDQATHIVIKYDSPQSSSDLAGAYFYVRRNTVASIEAEDDEADPDWNLLSSLATEASRCVVGWDSALEKVENALGSSDPVGMPEDPFSAGGDDIPF